MPRLSCREMNDADLDRVLAIEDVSFSTPWTRRHFLHEMHANPHGWNLVQCSGDEIVGYASMWILGHELHINDIAVDPERRRAGYGTKLMRHIIEEASALGCTRVLLEVRSRNVAARKLYESLGFRISGLRHGYYQDTGDDALLMDWKIRGK